MQLLLNKGANVESTNNMGQTLLSVAAANGQEAAMRMLLKNGAHVESRDRDGRTPLSWATANGHEAAVCLLLDRGARADVEDRDGWTPLLRAVASEHVGVARLLINKGADPRLHDTLLKPGGGGVPSSRRSTHDDNWAIWRGIYYQKESIPIQLQRMLGFAVMSDVVRALMADDSGLKFVEEVFALALDLGQTIHNWRTHHLSASGTLGKLLERYSIHTFAWDQVGVNEHHLKRGPNLDATAHTFNMSLIHQHFQVCQPGQKWEPTGIQTMYELVKFLQVEVKVQDFMPLSLPA